MWPTCRRWVSLEEAHEHEVPWRSHGGDPTDLDHVCTLCGACHGHIHPRVGGALKKIEGDNVREMVFWERRTGRDEWRNVTQAA